MKKTRKVAGRTSRGFLIPDPEDLEKRRRKLPYFPPHDLTALLSETRSQGLTGKEPDEAIVLRIRQRNNEQMAKLVEALGVNAADPRRWERAFFALAHLHHGVSCLTFKKPNRNASTWTDAHELLLIQGVVTLTSQGLS